MPIQINTIKQAFHDLEHMANGGEGGLPERHIEFMARVVCYGFMMGCKAEREPKMQAGKLIMTYNGQRIFTIRSIKAGMWVEFKDPNNNLIADILSTRPIHHLTLKQHKTKKQHKKYNMNRTTYFQDGNIELEDVCSLIEYSISFVSG